jgi:MFS family permease
MERRLHTVSEDCGVRQTCPYFGDGEAGCGVGFDQSSAADVKRMVRFCSGRFGQCFRYAVLSHWNPAGGDGSLGLDLPTASVAWDVLQHELRSPLAAITAAAEVLARMPDDAGAARSRFVSIIQQESGRMRHTVEALFDGVNQCTESRVDVPEPHHPSEGRSNSMAKGRWSKGWRVALAGTGINLALGILYTWSIFKSAIHSSIETGGPGAFQWDLAAINDPYAVCCLVFAFAMIAGGRVQDRFGPRLTAMAGGLLVGAGFLLMALSNAYAMWVIGFGVLAGLGIGFGYSAATPPALKWFPPKQTGLVAGVVVSGFGLASVYIAPLAKYLLGTVGLQTSMLIFGVAFAIVVGLLSLLLVNPDAAAGSGQTGRNPVVAASVAGLSPTQVLKTPGFYALWLVFFAASGAGLMVIGSVAGMAKASLGEAAFVAVAVLAVGNASGRIVAGVLSDKIGRGLTLAIMLLFQAVLMYAAAAGIQGYGPTGLVTLAGLIGFNYGTNLSLFPSFAKDRWGMANFGTNYGLLFSAWGVGGLVAGRVSQILIASSGSFNSSFLIACGSLLMAATIALSLEDSRKPILVLIRNHTPLRTRTSAQGGQSRKVA